MRTRHLAGYLVLVFMFSLAASPLLADGTLLGTISGNVLDQDGRALPGATVEVVSEQKGFQRSVTSDANGGFNFPLLQPGPYTVRVSLSGFQTFESNQNIVAADKTTAVSPTLRLAATQEAVIVTGESPLVDKTNATATTVVTSALTDKIPVGRSYQTVINFAPGVTNPSGSGNPNSHGALAGNNLYLFDGVDTTDVTTGTFGQNFNFEAIQEVSVSTTGISAEFGRAQGAVVNVITKSGGNDFQGSVKILATNDNWNADNKGNSPISGASFNRTKTDAEVYDYNYTLGGPIWRDHLWFFGAYNTVNQIRPAVQTQESTIFPDQTGQSVVPRVNVEGWDGKLSFQATSSHLFTYQFNSDPISGFVVDYWGASAELNGLTGQSQNDCSGVGCLQQGSWSGVFGSKLTGEARYAEQSGNITVFPLQAGSGSPFYSFGDELYYNGATFTGIVDRPRKQANLALSLYQDLFGSAHQFKAGVDWQDLESVSDFQYPTNTLFYVAQYDPTRSAADQQFQIGDVRQDFIPGPSVSTGNILGFYLMDKFEVGNRLSFNLGVRVENQTSDSDLNQTVIDTTNISPRLTGVYDLFGNGKTLASAAYGRYYQFLVQSIADSIFSGVPQQTNFDEFEWDGSQFVFSRSVRAGGANAQPINEDLDSSYVDEFNLALQQQIGNTMAVGIRGIYRKWYDIVDDRKAVVEGNKILTPENFSDEELSRYYKAIELTVEKRFSSRWQALANYTLARAEGNQFGVPSQFSTSLYDYAGGSCTPRDLSAQDCAAASITNQYGYAPYDRTHIFNMFAAYTLPLGFMNITAAPVFNFQSGTPYQRQRSFVTPGGESINYFYDKRGSSRLPNTYRLDFALETVFTPFGSTSIPFIGGPIEIGVKAEVFNLTNQQKVARNDLISLIPNDNEVGGNVPAPGVEPTSFFGAPTTRTALQRERNYRLTALLRF